MLKWKVSRLNWWSTISNQMRSFPPPAISSLLTPFFSFKVHKEEILWSFFFFYFLQDWELSETLLSLRQQDVRLSTESTRSEILLILIERVTRFCFYWFNKKWNSAYTELTSSEICICWVNKEWDSVYTDLTSSDILLLFIQQEVRLCLYIVNK